MYAIGNKITSQNLIEFLLSEGWEEYQGPDDIPLRKFKKNVEIIDSTGLAANENPRAAEKSVRIFVCTRPDLDIYNDLIDRAVYTLSKVMLLDCEQVERKIFSMQPMVAVSVNAGSGKTNISLIGSKKLREFGKSLLHKSADEIRREKNLVKSDVDEFLERCSEPQTEAASYKTYFVLPPESERLNINSLEVIQKVKNYLFDLNLLVESEAVPEFKEIQKSYPSIDLKFVRLIRSIKDISEVTSAVEFRVGAKKDLSKYEINYRDETLTVLQDLKKKLSEKKDDAGPSPVIVAITGQAISKLKDYAIYIQGHIIKSKRGVRVYLSKEQSEKIMASVWEPLSRGEQVLYKFEGIKDSRKGFDNVLNVSKFEPADEVS